MDQKEKNITLLKKFWGYASFKAVQERCIESAQAGKDTLVLMPTGGGKSICFQIPALSCDGICLVVSPLISLIRDQVQHLNERGIPALAVYSGMSSHSIDITLDNAIYGKYKFLYVSPERLATEIFKSRVARMNINYLAVDEAHCISKWGYDFRPAYLKIAEIKELIGNVPVIALTATATAEVAKDIMSNLGFKEENIISTDLYRSNIAYLVKESDDKLGTLLRLCRSADKTFNAKRASGIVYCRERRVCQEIAAFLNANGVSADYYHAGLGRESRNLKQTEWTRGKYNVIVATNAFGMGIDKPDVRFVAHYDIPDSIESYFQEAGRVGRDGERAWALLLWNATDIKRLRGLEAVSHPSEEYMAEVYQAMFNYQKIAYGDGAGRVCKFDLQNFAREYKFSTVNSYYAIKYLEQEGYWEVTDEIDNPPRIMFEVSREELYHIQLGDAVMDSFIKSVLRMYTGLFSHLVTIDENFIAKITTDSVENVRAKLLYLAKRKVIRYIPQIRTPLVFFKDERLTPDNFCIDRERYAQRKEVSEKRIEGIIHYASQTSECRSRVLTNYFSQSHNSDCGKCDVCIGKRGQPDRNRIREDLLHKISDRGTLNLSDVRALAGALYENDYLSVLRELIDSGEILCDRSGNLKVS